MTLRCHALPRGTTRATRTPLRAQALRQAQGFV